jgi:ABC-type Mn2+/Zn2+ transport system ATPase subunit
VKPAVAPLLALQGVHARYGAVDVLEDVDLEVAPGELVGVVGPSGSGKTSLLRVITGTLRPTAGRVVRRHGLRLSYVPQVETVNWSFPVTVEECLLMARAGRRWPWRSKAEQAELDQLLEQLGLSGLGRRHIRALSGGQQQRVFIARALIRRPDLLIMDEPTSGVDVRTRHELFHLLLELNAAGLAMLLTTHDLNGVAAHVPRLVCLNRRVLGDGPTRSVLTPAVLEQTYGAPMDVLEHAGMPVVVDRAASVIPLRREVG